MKQSIDRTEIGQRFSVGLKDLRVSLSSFNYVYGIPKNGLIIAQMQVSIAPVILLTLKDVKARLLVGQRVLIIDDVKDSGRTEQKIKDYLGEKCLEYANFLYIVDKQKEKNENWIHFPWEDFEEMKDAADRELRETQKKEGIGKTNKEWYKHFEALERHRCKRLANLLSLAGMVEQRPVDSDYLVFGPSRPNSPLGKLAAATDGGYGRAVTHMLKKLKQIVVIPVRGVKKNQPSLI